MSEEACTKHSGATTEPPLNFIWALESTSPTTQDILVLWIGGRCGKGRTGHSGQENRMGQGHEDIKRHGILPELQGLPYGPVYFIQSIEYRRMDREGAGRLESRQELDHGRSGVACHAREFRLFQKTMRIH